MFLRFLQALLILILFHTSVRASSDLDSLKNLLDHTEAEDKKIDIYKIIYKRFRHTLPDTVLIYLDKQIVSANEIEDTRSLGLAYFRKGLIFRSKGNYDGSIESYLKAARIFKTNNFPSLYASTLNNIGYILITAGNYKTAIDFLKKVIETYEKSGEKKMLCVAYRNIGYCYFELKEFHNSNNSYLSALRLSYELDDPYQIYQTNNYLGDLALEQSQYNLSRQRYNEALSVIEQLSGSVLKKAVIFNNIGRTFLDQNNLDSASGYFEEALKIKQSLVGYNNSQMITLTQMGLLELKRSNVQKSLSLWEKGMMLGDTSYINKDLNDALELIGNQYEGLVEGGIAINQLKWYRLNRALAGQNSKLIKLQNRLEASDIQNILYLRVELDKTAALLNQEQSISRKSMILLGLACLLFVITAVLYFKARQKSKEAKRHLATANEKLERSIKVLMQ